MNIHTTPDHATQPPSAIRALVLDDDDFDRRRLCRMSSATGLSLKIETAATIDGLREKLDAAEYDLIFLDYRLAQDTGLDALSVIHDHQVNGNAATVMVTGNAQPDLAVTAFKAGCRDVLIKDDLNPEILKASVLSVLPDEMVQTLTPPLQNEVDRTLVAMAQQKLPEVVLKVLSAPEVQEALMTHFDDRINAAVTRAFEVYWGPSATVSDRDIADLLNESDLYKSVLSPPE